MTTMHDESLFSYSVGPDNVGQRLDVFLKEQSGVTRSRIQRAVRSGHAAVNGIAIPKTSHRLEDGDTVVCSMPPQKEQVFVPEDLPLDIMYEDRHIIVVNKSAGMVVHPGRGNTTW